MHVGELRNDGGNMGLQDRHATLEADLIKPVWVEQSSMTDDFW
jgi:hypothetical protein